MARLSRTHFPVHEDDEVVNTTSSTSDGSPAQTALLKVKSDDNKRILGIARLDDGKQRDGGSSANNDAYDARRGSAITDASISSMPDSLYLTDSEYGLPMHKPYEAPSGRPVVRRPDLLPRSTPRPRVQSRLRSRTGIPSKATRARVDDASQSAMSEKDGSKQFPLLLLHVDLLPIKWRWSEDTAQEILPLDVQQDLQLLQSKVDCIIQKRGILIRHPGCEYDLLEERLLQALGLQSQRITADGHFVRPRIWTEEDVPELSHADESDSGLESSAHSSDSGRCSTCHHHCIEAGTHVIAAGKKWSFKVFAANGLLTASTWAACWEEMERVDIEILPWLSDDLKRKLDQRDEEESSYRRAAEESERIRLLVEEHVQLALEEAAESARIEHSIIDEHAAAATGAESDFAHGISQELILERELPLIYSRSQIPLSVLLKNYVYILAQDRRNVVIVGLLLALMLVGFRALVGDHAQLAKPDRNLEHLPRIKCEGTQQSSNMISSAIDGPAGIIDPSTVSSDSIYEAIIPPSATELAAKSMDNEPSLYVEEHEDGSTHPQALAQMPQDEDLGMCSVPAYTFEVLDMLSWPFCGEDKVAF